MPRLYEELADWFPLLSPPADYEEEAAYYARTLEGASDTPVRSVLELGSGAGSNASHLKKRFEMALVEPSAGMRAVSRRLNPDCEHIEGDMRSLRLAREFDAVFVHDAVCYMTVETDLQAAMRTAFLHCRAGGVAVFAPDFVRENFRPSTDHGGSDAESRGLRYVEWTWDPDPSDTTYVVDYACLLRRPEGTVCEYDRHVAGLFARSEWISLLTGVGFEARSVPFEHSEVEPGHHEIFVAKKPTAAKP
jgi:SAM-dependent methyltransferase